MSPLLSHTRWTFVVKPPRERPSAWSDGSSICVDSRPPRRGVPRAPFGGSGCGTAGADDRPVDAPKIAVNLAPFIQVVEQRCRDPDPSAVAAPAVEATENCCPRPEALGEITPGRTGVENPEDSIDDSPTVCGRTTRSFATLAAREEWGDASPLPIRKLVTAHGKVPAIN